LGIHGIRYVNTSNTQILSLPPPPPTLMHACAAEVQELCVKEGLIEVLVTMLSAPTGHAYQILGNLMCIAFNGTLNSSSCGGALLRS
jgi:hypothetical protein